MIQIFHNVNIDWLGNRRKFIFVSIVLMLAVLISAVTRQAVPGGTDAFNLGVDFKGGTVVTVSFIKGQTPTAEAINAELNKQGIRDAIVQPVSGKPQFLIKLPQQGPASAPSADTKAEADTGRSKVRSSLNSFGPENDPIDPNNGLY